MHELVREIEDALSGPLHGRQWAKDLFWDLLSFDRVASSVPFEVLPGKDRWGISESLTWARLDDIRVVLFKKTNGAWDDDRLDAIACTVGQVWRNALMLFVDQQEKLWYLVVCTPRVEGQAGISRRVDMTAASRDRRVIGLIAELSPETATPSSKAMHDLWIAGQPMRDVVTRMLYQLPRRRRRQVKQSGFLKFIRPYAMHPLLRKSEEHALGRRIQNGDQDAWRELIEQNVRMGFWGANRFAWPEVEFQEGFQYSMMGLMRAAQKFDPDQGTRFSTYAFHWMRQFCQREYDKNRSTVYVPDYQQKPVRDYIKQRRQQPFREKPWTEGEWEFDRLARLTSPEPYEWARSTVHQEASGELDPSIMFQSRIDLKTRVAAIKAALQDASQRNQNILAHRFGLDNTEELTLEECGRLYDMTREGVRQVEKKLLEHLRYVLPRRYPTLFEVCLVDQKSGDDASE